jgi:hypothetical protein
MQRRWIQRAVRLQTRGALHRALGVPLGERIPLAMLREAAEHPERFRETHAAQALLRRRARFALNVRGLGR